METFCSNVKSLKEGAKLLHFHKDISTEYNQFFLSPYENNASIRGDTQNKPVSLDPSVIQSIGRYYDIISDENSDDQLPSLSLQAANIISVAMEFSLRLLIKTANQFSQHFIGSKAKNNVLQFSHVIDAMEFFYIKIQNKPCHCLTLGGSMISSKYVNALQSAGAPGCTYYPRNIFLEHWNLLSHNNHLNQSGPQYLTEQSDYTSDSKDHSAPLPLVTIQWVAVDGHLVDTFMNKETVFWEGKKESDKSSQYKINLCVDDVTIKSHNNKCRANSLSIIGQTERVYHDLTREHFLLLNKLQEIFRKPFYDPSTEYCKSISQGLLALEKSPGLRQLVPYLIHFVTQQIYTPLASPTVFVVEAAGLRTILRVIVALLKNSSLQLEHYVHQIVQSIQTLVLHPLLGCKGLTVQGSIAMRHAAAKTLAFVCEHFASLHGPGVGGLMGRTVASVYRSALNINQPLPTILGAVIGLRCLGPRALQVVFLSRIPILTKLLKLVSHAPDAYKSSFDHTFHQFRICLAIELLFSISDMLTETLSSDTLENHDFLSLVIPLHPQVIEPLREAYDTLAEIIGDSLTPFMTAVLHRNNQQGSSPCDEQYKMNADNLADVFMTTL